MTALGPGLRVKCIHDGPWKGECPGPSNGSVWTVSEVCREGTFRQGWFALYRLAFDFIALKEWPNRSIFPAHHFVPLSGNEDISALEAALKKGRVDSDAPARKRELERAK